MLASVFLALELAEVAMGSAVGVGILWIAMEVASVARQAVFAPRDRPWLMAVGLFSIGSVAFVAAFAALEGLRLWVFWPMFALAAVSVGIEWTAIFRRARLSVEPGGAV
jgi:hypothetical protein